MLRCSMLCCDAPRRMIIRSEAWRWIMLRYRSISHCTMGRDYRRLWKAHSFCASLLPCNSAAETGFLPWFWSSEGSFPHMSSSLEECFSFFFFLFFNKQTPVSPLRRGWPRSLRTREKQTNRHEPTNKRISKWAHRAVGCGGTGERGAFTLHICPNEWSDQNEYVTKFLLAQRACLFRAVLFHTNTSSPKSGVECTHWQSLTRPRQLHRRSALVEKNNSEHGQTERGMSKKPVNKRATNRHESGVSKTGFSKWIDIHKRSKTVRRK